MTEASELTVDQRVEQRRMARATIGLGIDRMRDRLLGAGFTPHRVFELMHPATELIVGFNYVADECTVTIVLASPRGWREREGRGELPMRIHQALIARQPTVVDDLGEIVLALTRGHPVDAYYEASGLLLGLEFAGTLVGERTNRMTRFNESVTLS